MHTRIQGILKITCYLSMFSVLVACSFTTRIQSEVLVSFDSNPDVTGRPSPLVVRVYELKSDTIFNSADFYMLYDDEKATLGGDLLSRADFELSPGAGKKIVHVANEQARFLGVLAAYRNIEEANWRAIIKLKLKSKNTSIIRVGKQSVKIEIK